MSKTPAEQQTSALSDIRFWTLAKFVVLVPWGAALVAALVTGGDRWIHVALSLAILEVLASCIVADSRARLAEANLRALVEGGAIR
jgi:uncharacterized transporter YbjL